MTTDQWNSDPAMVMVDVGTYDVIDLDAPISDYVRASGVSGGAAVELVDVLRLFPVEVPA